MTNAVPAEAWGALDAEHAPRLRERWATTLDGPVIASPLFAEAPVVRGELHGVVYAATQAGSVYALSAATGSVLWRRSLGTALSTCDEEEAGVAATYGIVSTGVIDRQRNALYVIGATGLLYALDLTTGETHAGWPVQVVSETSGELVWGGLTLAGNQVLVPVASYCDEPGTDGLYADGRLVGVNVDTASVESAFDVVPGPANMGGIWGFGGASVDPLTGDLWAASGNSWVYDPTCDCIVETVGYAESVVELDPALNVIAADRPTGIPGPIEDADFGSTPLLFQPPGCPPLAAASSKTGFVYGWRRDSLATGPIWSTRAGPDDLLDPFIGEPSYSPGLNELVIADARAYDQEGSVTHFDAVEAFAVGADCTLPDTPTWTAPDIGRGPKPPALLVDDVAVVAGGYIPGLFVLDARTGALLWSTELVGAAYSPPAYADGAVIAADAGGTVHAYGIGVFPLARHYPLDP